MMIKQMVTRLEDPKVASQANTNPYTEGVYYVAEAIRDYLKKDSLIRDHIFNSIFFLELLTQYNNTSDYAEDKPIYLPQDPKYKSKLSFYDRQDYGGAGP
jgi:hypothetical protein